MRFIAFIIGLLLVSATASAQQPKSFVSPGLAFSRELFPKPGDSVQMPRLIQMSQRVPAAAPAPNLTSLPADYSWGKDVRRSESLKQAAYKPYNYDALGRSPLPDAGSDATQQLLMKSAPVH